MTYPCLTHDPTVGRGMTSCRTMTPSGGAKVLDGIGKALGLSARDMEPSRAVLNDYGNVSSSTTWYTLGFVESLRGVRKGDSIMQVRVCIFKFN